MRIAARGLPGRSGNDLPKAQKKSDALKVVEAAAARMAARRAIQIHRFNGFKGVKETVETVVIVVDIKHPAKAEC